MEASAKRGVWPRDLRVHMVLRWSAEKREYENESLKFVHVVIIFYCYPFSVINGFYGRVLDVPSFPHNKFTFEIFAPTTRRSNHKIVV